MNEKIKQKMLSVKEGAKRIFTPAKLSVVALLLSACSKIDPAAYSQSSIETICGYGVFGVLGLGFMGLVGLDIIMTNRRDK